MASFTETDLVSTINVAPEYMPLSGLKPSGPIGAAINILLGLSGVVAFLYLLWGGLQYLTSGGEKEAIEKARRRITHALIGLAGVFSAYALLFIVQAIFGIALIQVDLGLIGSQSGSTTTPPGGLVTAATHCSSNASWPIGFCGIGPCTGPGCYCTAPGSGCNGSSYAQFCPGPPCP